MAVDLRFILTGAKRVFDSRPMYAQVAITDACDLSCAYCDERRAGAPLAPAAVLRDRIDRLDALGVQVYDFVGGEPLLHPDIAGIVRHAKSARGGSTLVTVITNGLNLTERLVEDFNSAGLDFLQVSVDSLDPTRLSEKSLRRVLPRLRVLAERAAFTVEVQTVLNEETCSGYDRFRREFDGLPFAFGFSIMHGRGGRIAIRGREYVELLRRHGVFEGVNFYGEHLAEMLQGDFSRPWKCLGGFKFLYVNADGGVQWCGQQRGRTIPLETADLESLRRNDSHKPCEAGCSLGCARMVSHTLGEPLRTLGASVRLAMRMGGRARRPGKAQRTAAV